MMTRNECVFDKIPSIVTDETMMTVARA